MPSVGTGNYRRLSSYSGLTSSNKLLAWALLCIALGVNLAGHGLIRIHNGVSASVGTTAANPHSRTA